MKNPDDTVVTPSARILVYYYDLPYDEFMDYVMWPWQIVSFGRRHFNYQNPADWIIVDPDSLEVSIVPEKPELQAAYDRGEVFVLSYYEHGGCVWSLRGEGPQCRWDTAQIAGLAILDTGQTAGLTIPESCSELSTEDRTAACRYALASYTAWCNGEAYEYDIQVESPNGNTVETGNVVFGISSLIDYIRNDLAQLRITNYVVEDNAIINNTDIGPINISEE